MAFTIDYSPVRSKQRKYWQSALGALFGRKAVGAAVTELKVATGNFDVALNGGAIGVYELGVKLPAGAIITRSYYEVLTTFVTAGSDAGTIALKVGAVDLKAAIAVSDVSNPWDAGRKDGAQTGTAANMSKLSADGELTLTIAGQIASAGKLKVFVEYVI
jgi:hypothetical protein